jgi:hypothetical protein
VIHILSWLANLSTVENFSTIPSRPGHMLASLTTSRCGGTNTPLMNSFGTGSMARPTLSITGYKATCTIISRKWARHKLLAKIMQYGKKSADASDVNTVYLREIDMVERVFAGVRFKTPLSIFDKFSCDSTSRCLTLSILHHTYWSLLESWRF